MKTSRVLAGALAAAILALATPPPSSAAPRAACSILTLAQVRAIAGAPVAIYVPGSSEPTVRGDVTSSSCTYTALGAAVRGARLSLLWGPRALLDASYKFYTKRHKELRQIKGDVFVLASVTTATHSGLTYDLPASKKLLEAAVQKLP